MPNNDSCGLRCRARRSMHLLAAGLAFCGASGTVGADPNTSLLAQAGGPPFSLSPRAIRRDPATIQTEAVTDEAVLQSMRRGGAYLLDRLDVPDAGKADHDRWIGDVPGWRVLALYAILQVGHATRDEEFSFRAKRLAEHVKWLTELKTDQTYVAALQACALAVLPDKAEHRRVLTRVCSDLVTGMQEGGGYTYTLRSNESHAGPRRRAPGFVAAGGFDNSNSQYGLLGVWAAAEAGVEVPTSYWRTTDAFWRKVQARDGGWDYSTGSEASTPSMTTAGIASLLVASEFLDIEPRLEAKRDDGLEKAMAHLVRTYDPKADDLYYQYGIERIGLASGLKSIGGVDWYRQTAASLLSAQRHDGSWSSEFIGATPEVSTAYAMLFLVRGRSPVLFSKLQYEGPWNARPRDDANLTHRIGRTFECPLNWQVVNLRDDAAAIQQAPILLVTGSKDPAFSAEEVAKLREYVTAGGLIFSSADGGNQAFTDAIRKYAAAVSSGRYEMRDLPADHPLFSIHERLPNPPRMMGLSNGIRELWVHSPTDLGAAWQARAYAKRECWTVPANLYLYATGKASLRTKLQTDQIPASEHRPRRTVTVARVVYSGNDDPEPGAWARLSRRAISDFATEIKVTETPVRQLDAAKVQLAYLTGTTRFRLNAVDQLRLKEYCESGGTLLLDAAAGSTAFARSAADLAKAMFPDATLLDLPIDHAIYKGSMPDGQPITTVDYRPGQSLSRSAEHLPRLRGVQVDGRWVIIYSGDDMLSGLLGVNTWGIAGYTPRSAQALWRNVVLYAANRGSSGSTR